MSPQIAPLRIHNYVNTSGNTGEFLEGHPDSGMQITFHGPNCESNHSGRLKEYTGCCNIGEFISRLLGDSEIVSTPQSYLYMNLHDHGNLYIDVECHMTAHNGSHVGVMRRRFEPSLSLVQHELLKIETGFRRLGCGTRIYQSQEEAWKVAGYQSIRLLAGKEMGGYVWALNGYDYFGSHGDSARLRHIESIISQIANLASGDLISDRTRDVLIGAANQLKYPWQVAAFIIPPRVILGEIANHETLYVGKIALKRYEWSGYKELAEDWKGNDVAKATRLLKLGA